VTALEEFREKAQVCREWAMRDPREAHFWAACAERFDRRADRLAAEAARHPRASS
jgi:hypothetical protein